jgi:thiamine transport system permease protein
MEVEIYRLLKMNVDFRSAAFLSLIQSFFSLSIIFLYLRLQRRAGIQNEMAAASVPVQSKGRAGPAVKMLLLIYASLMIVLIGGPIISVVVQSFLERPTWSGGLRFTLDWYKDIFTHSRTGAGAPLIGIRNSLFFGLISALLSLALGTALARLFRKWKSSTGAVLETMVMLPMGISSVVLGLSYVIIARFLQGSAGGLNGLFIIFAHTIITYPFVLRTMQAALSKIGPSMKEAALSLGASSGAVFRTIEFPLLRASLISAASFAFAISIGEINATIMLAGSGLVTIPIVMLRLISSYNFFAACALGTLLIIVTSSVFLIFEKFGGERS